MFWKSLITVVNVNDWQRVTVATQLTLASRKAVTHRTKDASSSQHRYLVHFGVFFCT